MFLASNEHTLKIEPNKVLTIFLQNNSPKRLEHHFFEHQTYSNVFILLELNSNTLFLDSNIEHSTMVVPLDYLSLDLSNHFEHNETTVTTLI